MRSALFWGFSLIIIGSVMALQVAGIIPGVSWGVIWGVFLILLGVWVLMGRGRKHNFEGGDQVSVALGSAQKANIKLDFGAGAMDVTSGAPSGLLLDGAAGTTLEIKSHLDGETLNIKVEAGPSFLPFLGPDGGAWQFRFTDAIPLSIEVNSGACSTNFDLSGLKVAELAYNTGASSNSLTLPANAGHTYVKVDGGASSFDVRVPQGVAAKVLIDQGATAVNIDQNRFVHSFDNYYQSPDFDAAENRVEILIKMGAGSVSIH